MDWGDWVLIVFAFIVLLVGAAYLKVQSIEKRDAVPGQALPLDRLQSTQEFRHNLHHQYSALTVRPLETIFLTRIVDVFTAIYNPSDQKRAGPANLNRSISGVSA